MVSKKNKRKYGTVSLPLKLIGKIKKEMRGTGFNSVSGYVEYVMREFITAGSIGKKGKEQEERVKARLKALGYIQ